MNCLRVSQAPERAPTIAAWPQLADARPTPSATRCCMPYSSLTEHQSCPVPSHSLARALAAPERSRHGRRRQTPMPPLLPRLQPSCACTERRYASVASRRPSCAPFSVTAAAGAPSPPVPAGSSHRLLWPRHHRPRRAKLGSPACAHGPLGASPSLPRRRRTFSGRNSKLRPSSALFFRPGTSRKNSSKGEGLTA